jgi:hypothetical protein
MSQDTLYIKTVTRVLYVRATVASSQLISRSLLSRMQASQAIESISIKIARRIGGYAYGKELGGSVFHCS